MAFLVRTAAAALTSSLSATSLPALQFQAVRCASKKASGSSKNRIGRAKKKFRGFTVKDGDFVHKGDVLARQNGLRYYAGENVSMDRDWSLKAVYDGVVVISTEQLNPYPDSPLYGPVKNGLVLNKQFVSVIPTLLHGKFKLVSET